MTPHKSDRFPGTHFQLSFVPGDSKRSSKGISPGMFIFIASFMCGVIYSVSESPAQLILVRLPDGKITWAELHWFEAHGIGKKRNQTQTGSLKSTNGSPTELAPDLPSASGEPDSISLLKGFIGFWKTESQLDTVCCA